MQSLSQFIKEQEQLISEGDMLLEKLITFGGKAYPRFGNILIMAGGAGSGKGFVQKNLVGLEGLTFDVDRLKEISLKAPNLMRKVKDETGYDLKQLDLKNPSDVSRLHELIGDYLKLPKTREATVVKSVLASNKDRKPNLIFDVTLKDLRKLDKLTRLVTDIGYAKEDIHVVWVVNDVKVAIEQNKTRDRVVAKDILINTHRGVSSTMRDILDMGDEVKKYFNGDMVFAFNQVGVDSELAKSVAPEGGAGRKIGMRGDTKGGKYITNADYVYIKRRGKSMTPFSDIAKSLKDKIGQYVPKNVEWS